MIKLLVVLLYSIIISSLSSCTSIHRPVVAPNLQAKGLNQIPVHKNGCGPASLITAYRFGSLKWNKALKHIPGKTDKEKFDHLVKNHGKVFSKHLSLQRRFDDKHGINIVDLTDLANDFQAKQQLQLPKLKYHSHFLKGKMDHNQLLKKTHTHLTKSLAQGFPPILSIKTFAQVGSRWTQVHGHFVVLYQIPKKLPDDAKSFEVKYIDPWGGNIKTGFIKLPEKAFYATNVATKKLVPKRSPLLEVDFPDSLLGSQTLKSNQRHATTIAFSIASESSILGLSK